MADEEKQILAVICCGRRLREIPVDTTRLVLAHCSGCDTTRWFADGLPLDRTSTTSHGSDVELPRRRASET